MIVLRLYFLKSDFLFIFYLFFLTFLPSTSLTAKHNANIKFSHLILKYITHLNLIYYDFMIFLILFLLSYLKSIQTILSIEFQLFQHSYFREQFITLLLTFYYFIIGNNILNILINFKLPLIIFHKKSQRQ